MATILHFFDVFWVFSLVKVPTGAQYHVERLQTIIASWKSNWDEPSDSRRVYVYIWNRHRGILVWMSLKVARFLQDENFSARFIGDSPIWSKWLPEPPPEQSLWEQTERVIPRIFSWFGYWGCSPWSGEQARKIGALRMCTHEAQKYQFCTHQAPFWYYIGLYEPAVILVRNLVEKLTKKCQSVSFFQKKILKALGNLIS